MNRKFGLLLFLLPLVGLTGCRAMVGDRTPDEQDALNKVALQSAYKSDRAGVIFAEKTLALAEKQAGSDPQHASPDAERRIARAKADLSVAQTMFRLTQERQQTYNEYMAWKSFSQTPIMANATQDPD